jgi:hypothetical protein
MPGMHAADNRELETAYRFVCKRRDADLSYEGNVSGRSMQEGSRRLSSRVQTWKPRSVSIVVRYLGATP